MLDRDIAKLRQIRIAGKGNACGNSRTARRSRLPLRWRLGHVMGYTSRHGPVAQGIEQRPSKLKVAGSKSSRGRHKVKGLAAASAASCNFLGCGVATFVRRMFGNSIENQG